MMANTITGKTFFILEKLILQDVVLFSKVFQVQERNGKLIFFFFTYYNMSDNVIKNKEFSRKEKRFLTSLLFLH